MDPAGFCSWCSRAGIQGSGNSPSLVLLAGWLEIHPGAKSQRGT